MAHANVSELTNLRQVLLTIERQALSQPPTAIDAVLLDRLVPAPPGDRSGVSMSSLEASAALGHEVDKAVRRHELTLRGFRAAVAACEITARYALALPGKPAERNAAAVAPLAWQLLGRLSLTFSDGRGMDTDHHVGVIGAARAQVHSLRADLGRASDAASLEPALRNEALALIRDMAGQLPELGARLTTAVDHWAGSGTLLARARDLPQMADMPLPRVTDVLTGRSVRAHGDDLSILRLAAVRAADLSRLLADGIDVAVPRTLPAQPHVIAAHRLRLAAPDATDRLLQHADAVMHAHFPQVSRRMPGPDRQPP
jgi:hypothetical protein